MKNSRGILVKPCEICGNEYENAITILHNDRWHTFDCFECAVYALAPRCEECHVYVLGHGVQSGSEIYCSAHCARKAGYAEARDHVESRVYNSN